MTYRRPLIDALVPIRAVSLRVPLQVTVGVAFLALLAQVELTIGPVPITGQTFGVLLLGAAYGGRLGALTLLAYLAVGGFGLGVFAGGGAGWSYFTGTTTGYLVGFVLAAALVGAVARRGLTRSFGGAALAMLLGNVAIYLPGLAWLYAFAGQYAPADVSPLAWTLSAGLVPFIPGDVLKLLAAAALLPLAERLLRRP